MNLVDEEDKIYDPRDTTLTFVDSPDDLDPLRKKLRYYVLCLVNGSNDECVSYLGRNSVQVV